MCQHARLLKPTSIGIVAVLTFADMALAGSVKMIPEDTVVGIGKWNVEPSCGGGNCWVTYITDGIDANYLWSLTGLVQNVTLTNTSGIPSDATIDSYVVWIRAATNATGGNDRVLPRMRTAQSANYCDGANINLETTAFADSSRKFTTFPTGPATCGTPLTIARMDSLRFQFNDVIGDTLKITECSVVVWYTEAGAAQKGRRRHLLTDEGGFEKFAEYCQFDANVTERFMSPYWIWRE